MHEVSIAQSIADTLMQEYDESELEKVREIHVRVGMLSGVEHKLLEHVFTFVIDGTALSKSILKTELTEVIAFCVHCQAEFKVEQYIFTCPSCNSPSSDVRQGNELTICKIIMEEPIYEETNK
ncbi:MAG: hydrogenase maturation nickel metallochaperone HypA [Ginsengibacter sp.]